MLEDNNCCCVCGREVHRRVGGVPAYYCSFCFEEYRTDIINNAPWVKFLMNQEKQRRKRRNRLLAANFLLRPLYVSVRGAAYGWN